jgi:hypothetical protein
MIIAGAPAAPDSPGHGQEGGAAEGQASSETERPGAAAGTGAARLKAPPFSWLGGDAWPNFPAWADRQP